VSDGALVGKDLVIIPTLEGLVTKEMDLVIVVGGDEFEAVGLVPTSGEAIEADLSSNRVGEIQAGEFLLHDLHHGFTDPVLQIKLFILVALLPRAVSADGGNVEHAAPEFKKRPTLKTLKHRMKSNRNIVH
jgi:hypothetical protein